MADNQTNKWSELIAHCLEGQPKAQKQLFDLLAPKMYAVCLRYAKNPDEAKDVLQESFIRVFKHLATFENKGAFEGWVKRIFVNTSIEFYRRNLKHSVLDNIEQLPDVGIESHTIALLKQADLMALVNRLPTGYRTVFNLFAIEGYTHEEIAEMLGISESTSKTQLHKARLHLQAWVLKQQLK